MLKNMSKSVSLSLRQDDLRTLQTIVEETAQ